MKKTILLMIVGMFFFTSCEDVYESDGFFEEGEVEASFDEGDEGDLTLYNVQGNAISKIKDYKVPNKYLDIQADKQLHEDVWEVVTELIPEIYRDKINQYQVFHGEGQLLGYVHAVESDDLSKWRFALGIDQATDLDEIKLSNDFIYTIIHEYGHVLTLNDEQLQVMSEGECDQYFTGEGCANADAYINKIVEIGWTDILSQGLDSEEIYERYPDRFSTEYAATNPGEDVAEVFTVFVIKDKAPRGQSIADKKIQALYEYPELVKLREEIRSNVGPVKMRSLSVEGYHKVLPKLHKHTSHKAHNHVHKHRA